MNRNERIAKRKYLKQIKSIRKRLKQHAKNWKPYDWSYLIEPLLIGLEGAHQYYSQSYNVWASDDDDEMPTRQEMCAELIAKYDYFLNIHDIHDEQAAWEDFCDTLKKYLLYLWD